MYPFILKLVNIFRLKKKACDELERLLAAVNIVLHPEKAKKVENIGDIIKDPGLIYTDEGQKLILKHRLFHQDEGILPLADSLIKANDELMNYQDDDDKISIRDNFGINMSKNLAQCGIAIHRNYLDMMQIVEKEQYFLETLFKPALEQMSKREDYKEAWKAPFKNFKGFLILLNIDLGLFYHLLDELDKMGFTGETIEVRNKNRGIIKNNVIVSVKADDFAHARYWIDYAKNKEWFDNGEIKTLNDLIFFIEQQDAYQLEQLIESKSFKKIFDEKEAEFFKKILEDIKKNTKSEPYPIAPQELAKDLAEEEKSLEQLKEVAEELKAPPWVNESIYREAKRIDDMEFVLGDTFPKIEEIQKVKKIKKSGLRRLRTRLKFERRKIKRNVRAVLNEGLRVLDESAKIRSKVMIQLKSEIARTQVKRELINAIQQNNFEHAKLWIAHAQKNSLFSEEEINLLINLVDNLVYTGYKQQSISRIYDDLLSIISVIESGRRDFLRLAGKGAAAGLVAATGLSFIDKLGSYAAINKNAQKTEINDIPQEEVKIIFVGDTMFPQAASEKSWWKKMHINDDPHIYFSNSESYIKNADLAIGNLEMPISDNKGTPIEGEKWHFKGPSFLAKILADAGFKVMSLANNHTLNYGPIGLADTIKHLRDAGVYPVGGGNNMYEAREPVILNIKGYKIGILAYCIMYIVDLLADSNKAGSAPYKSHNRIDFTKEKAYNYETFADDDRIQDIYPEDENYILEDLQKLRGKVNIIIVFFHWGRELGTHPFNYQRHIAKMTVDNGAAIVVGAGPHAVGEVETYNNGVIAYSLGNFLFGSKTRQSNGSMLEVTLKRGKIIEAKEYYLDVNNFGPNAFNPTTIGEPHQFV